MNLSHVELVLTVAQCGSISQAAESLYMSQSNLSKTIKSIEESIGKTLFHRTKTGIELTSFGQIYVEYAAEIVSQIHTLDRLSKTADYPKAELKVCSEGYPFLVSAFETIINKYISAPSHQYYLMDANFTQQVSMISQGQAELGFISIGRHTRKTTIMALRSNNLEFIKLHDAIPGVYVSSSSKVFPKDIHQIDKDSLKILADMPFLLLGTYTTDLSRSAAGHYLLQNGYSLKTPIIVNSWDRRTDLIKKMDGFCAAQYVHAMYGSSGFHPDLRFIPYAPEYEQYSEFGWIQRENHTRSPLANELIQLLRK